MSGQATLKKCAQRIQKEDIHFVDLRFTDMLGKEQHMSLPAAALSAEKMFDGSSIRGWQEIHESDLTLQLDWDTAMLDPFMKNKTLNIRCDVVDPTTQQGYERDPRSVAKRAEAYLQSTGIADTAYFGPEPEFFMFEDVRWKVDISGASYSIHSDEAAWASNEATEGGNRGHRPRVKGGYFPVPPGGFLSRYSSCYVSSLRKNGLGRRSASS